LRREAFDILPGIPDSFGRLASLSEERVSSTVLLVDAEPQVRPIIERHLDPSQWTLVQVSDGEQAMQAVKDRAPALVVLNVDIAKGWPLCTQLKRTYSAIPVIVVSFRLGKDVFNNHQKLDTRADAYHRLPEELEMLEISLGYFSSHKSETGDEDSAPNRPRPRRPQVAVPSGVVSRLETTVAEQARALEDARRQIEALEVERDAVAEKNRRQMLELMTVGPSSLMENVGETSALKERIAHLEAELLLSSRREDELRELRNALTQATGGLATKTAELERVNNERSALEVAGNHFEVQLDEARTANEHTRQMFEAQLMSLRAEKAQLAQRHTELEEAHRNARDQSTPGIHLEEAREAARREASDAADQLAEASVQLSNLANELTLAHNARLVADKEKRQAEERVGATEQLVAAASQRAAAAEQAWGNYQARIEQLEAALVAKHGESEQNLADKKSVEQALATSRRLMREYATDAARKAEELKTTHERTKELEALTSGFAATKEELQQALDFEKSLVESLERDLAAAKANATASPAELEALASQITEAQRRAVIEVESIKAQAAAQVAAARAGANDDLETLRLVAQSELDDARAQTRRELEAGQAQAAADVLAAQTELENWKAQAVAAIEATRAQAARDVEAAQAQATTDLTNAQAELAARRAKLEAANATEREALASHVATVHSRFEALVAYARALESRLVSAETRRSELEVKLEALVAEVRSHALSGEIPPPMDLPTAPQLNPTG